MSSSKKVRVFEFNVILVLATFQFFPILGGFRVKELFVGCFVAYYAFACFHVRRLLGANYPSVLFLSIWLMGMFWYAVSSSVVGFSSGFLALIVSDAVFIPFVLALAYRFSLVLPYMTSRDLSFSFWLIVSLLMLFFAYFSSRAGLNLIELLSAFLLGGESLQYALFKRVFSSIEEDAGSNARHTMAYIVFILGASIAVWRVFNGDKNGGSKGISVEEVTAIVVIFFVAMSRKVVLALVVFYFILWLHGAIKSSLNKKRVLLAFIGLAALFSIVPFIDVGDAGITDVVYQKYARDVTENPRLEQYRLSLSEVSSAGWSGVLLGHGLGVLSGEGFFAHNIFVHSLHQGGFVALILAMVMFFIIISIPITCMINLKNYREYVSYKTGLTFIMLAGSLVAITRMLTGVKGELSFIGVFSVGLLFGCYTLYKSSSWNIYFR